MTHTITHHYARRNRPWNTRGCCKVWHCVWCCASPDVRRTPPHEKHSGFLFFELPKEHKALNGPRLDLTATNLATHDRVRLATSLPAASFSAKQEENTPPPAQ